LISHARDGVTSTMTERLRHRELVTPKKGDKVILWS